MAFRFGRVGTDGLEIPGHYPARWNGDRVQVTFDVVASSAVLAKAQRDQVLGYGPENTDEPVVPVVSDEDSSLDGFYRVLSTEVSETIASHIDGAMGPSAAVELERVAGSSSPVVEVYRNGALRSNSHSFTNDVFVLGLPGSLRVPRFSVSQDGEGSVATSDGSVRVFGDGAAELSVSFMVDPGSFYEGAARVEVSYDEGVSWQVVTGRQVANRPGWVRLSNGWVRCTVSRSGVGSVLTAAVWDADAEAWEDVAFEVTDTSVTGVSTFTKSGLGSPYAICEGPDGNLWAVGSFAGVAKITPAGDITLYSLPSFAYSICVGNDDNLWIGTSVGTIIKVDTSGTVLATYTDTANLGLTADLCLGPDGNVWGVSGGGATNPYTAFKITTDGTVTAYTDAGFTSAPSGIASDGTDLWFTVRDDDELFKITTTGTFTRYTDANMDGPVGIAYGPDGNLWICSQNNDKILKATTSGSFTAYTTSVPDAPHRIASDGTDLWFTAQGSGAKLATITTSGTVTTITDPNIAASAGITEADGLIWFCSTSNQRIAVYDPDNTGALEFTGTLTILRNSPETAAIRLSANDGPEQLDLTLTRGHNYITGRVETDTATTLGVFRTTTETGTTLGTYGVTANTDNADGNRYIILSPDAITQDTTGISGISLTSSGTALNFAVAPDDADTLTGTATIAAAYMAAGPQRQTVAAR